MAENDGPRDLAAMLNLGSPRLRVGDRVRYQRKPGVVTAVERGWIWVHLDEDGADAGDYGVQARYVHKIK